MTTLAATPRNVLRALAVGAATALLLVAPASGDEPERDNFDARPIGASPPDAGVERARKQLRDRLGRFAALAVDPRTDTLRSIGRLDGFLTGPTGADGRVVALDYLHDHAEAFGIHAEDVDGLRLVDRNVVDGIEHLSWEQRYRGIPVADAGLQAALTGSGRLLNLTGPPAAHLKVRSIEPGIGAADAYVAARRSAGDSQPRVAVTAREGGAERTTRFGDGGRGSLTLYTAGSGYRLAWRFLVPVSSTGVYDVLVDARSGEQVRRINHVKFAVPAKVFRYNPGAGDQESEDFARWLASSTKLEGPNAHAFLDVHDTVGPQSSGVRLTPEADSDVAPVGGGYEFGLATVPSYGSVAESDGCPGTLTSFPSSICTWDPRPSGANSWRANEKQSVTQLFYLVNTFHDHLRDDPDIAFVVGGFRRNPGQPLGDPNAGATADASDPVLAQALDGAALASGLPDDPHTNNADFLTLPDGYPGLMQTYLWKPPFGAYDGANDAATVFHEYTHGLSGRLVTDAGGFEALSGAQAGALSEGWSDFYALDYLVQQRLQPDMPGAADVRFGRYFDNATGTRVRVQSIDCEPQPAASAGCPEAPGPAAGAGFTYEDFGKITNEGPEVHDDGEIWGQVLWSLRAALIGAHGEAAGTARARRYITDGMRLSPPEPSFLDMRNAILQASSDESDDDLMWTVFADRGMGYFAATDGSDDTAPLADFTDPADLAGEATLTGEVTDQDGRSVQGAEVAIGALGDEIVSLTDATGNYTLDVRVPAGGNHTYPSLRAHRAAYADDVRSNVPLNDGMTTTQDFVLERDWSSALGGASVTEYTGGDNSDQGCGPAGLIDDDPRVVWGTANTAGGQRIAIDLGAPVDIERIDIDPAAGCGDDASAALGAYELLGSTGPDGPFRALGFPGTFTATDNGRLNPAFLGTAPRVRFVRLAALSSQDNTAGASGATYIDVAEMHVARQPHTPVGPTANTGSAESVGIGGATLTGAVAPHDGAADVSFEYGTSTAYGATVAVMTLPAGNSATTVSAAIGGLQPSTTYHFRIVAQRDSQSYPGRDASFTTAAAPPPALPPAQPSTPPPPAAARLTALASTKLTANRKGFFRVKVTFGDAAPLGTARLTVLQNGKRLARVTTAVRRGLTVTKTLRLSKKGRRVIRAGQTKRVTLELRLPDGQKIKRSMKLTRRRR